MNTHEVLVAARNLIADEKDWCGLGWRSGESRCALHALMIAAGGTHAYDRWANVTERNPALSQSVMALYATCQGQHVGDFNDTHSHAEVLAAFDKAIAATAPQPDLSFLSDVTIRPEVEA